MAKLAIKAGATSQSVNLFIQSNSVTTGAGLTGLAYNTASLTAYYSFSGASAASVAISLVTLATLATAWSSGGFLQIDATNMPGWYRLDLPNAVLAAASGRSVSVHLQGAANMAPLPLEIELTGWDNQDAVHGGMSALPNTACTTNASLITAGTGTSQLTTSSGAVLLQATQTGVTIPTVTTVTNQLTAAAIATGVWQDSTGGDFTAASSIGKSLLNAFTVAGGSVFTTASLANAPTGGSAPTTAQIATAVWEDTTAGGDFGTTGSIGKLIVTTGITAAAVTGAVGSVTGAVGSVTGNVGGSVASVTGNVGGTVATLTTYTGNTPQTGDSYARIGALGASLTALAPSSTALSTAQWTNTRAGMLDLIGTQQINYATALAGFPFYLALSSDHYSPATGKTVTATRSLNGGAFGACTNAVAEIANGWYQINLSAGDLTGTTVALSFSAAASDTTLITIVTQP